MRGIHRGPVNSSHKWPVTRKMFPFDDVIMESILGIMTLESLRRRHNLLRRPHTLPFEMNKWMQFNALNHCYFTIMNVYSLISVQRKVCIFDLLWYFDWIQSTINFCGKRQNTDSGKPIQIWPSCCFFTFSERSEEKANKRLDGQIRIGLRQRIRGNFPSTNVFLNGRGCALATWNTTETL